MKVLLSLFVLLPGLVQAQSIFSEDEDQLRKGESSLLGSFFGAAEEGPAQRAGWQKFKSLEEYGQPQENINEVKAPPEPEEVKAAQDYYRSRDPFSNSNRLEQVYENLAPPNRNY